LAISIRAIAVSRGRKISEAHAYADDQKKRCCEFQENMLHGTNLSDALAEHSLFYIKLSSFLGDPFATSSNFVLPKARA
jgi:hypothetical protein